MLFTAKRHCYNNALQIHIPEGTQLENNALVGVIMGSQSDWEIMRHGVDILDQLNIPNETRVISAHRTPDVAFEYAKTAADRGLKVIIAGAGMAAALPGVIAAKTDLPVLGVPVMSAAFNGMDALLSIVQMPPGIPVGTLGVGKPGAINAAFLSAAILATSHPDILQALQQLKAARSKAVLEKPDPRLA
jgi:5-(carboxyamino)imidazole ribonucleotide mutase